MAMNQWIVDTFFGLVFDTFFGCYERKYNILNIVSKKIRRIWSLQTFEHTVYENPLE